MRMLATSIQHASYAHTQALMVAETTEVISHNARQIMRQLF